MYVQWTNPIRRAVGCVNHGVVHNAVQAVYELNEGDEILWKWVGGRRKQALVSALGAESRVEIGVATRFRKRALKNLKL